MATERTTDYTEMLARMVQQEDELEGADDPAQSDREGTVLERNESWRAPAVISQATGKWVTLYHTVTGLPHIMLEHNAIVALKARFRPKDGVADTMIGRLIFGAKPTVKPRYGTFLCWLHPDYPGAKLRHEQGFPVCFSDKIANSFQVEAHMKSKHKTSYEAMLREREEERRSTSEELQRRQIEALIAMAGVRSVPPQDQAANEPASVRVARRTRANTASGFATDCVQCGEHFSARTAAAAKSKLTVHRKSEHPEYS